MTYNHTTVEKKWQNYWLEAQTFRALDPEEAGDKPKKFILDMFPYPSGAGLHVGHPEGYTATDIVSRYYRSKGYNVLHPMGWDAFGLPAEQYAVKNNVHPAVTTKTNIDNFRRQIQMLGLSYDWQREVNTTDPSYYKWTQWIFLKLYNSYFDPFDQKAKPISHLVTELENDNLLVAPDGSIHINPTQEGTEVVLGGASGLRTWASYSLDEHRGILDGQRLAYTDEVPVNWCPKLGTVLSNEEVIDGKSEVGGFPVERRPLRQWMLRITAYADRLIDDLQPLQWPESLKEMQRNWIGKSVGAEVDFEVVALTSSSVDPLNRGISQDLKAATDQPINRSTDQPVITVFTTRPDTLFGATYMVLAPEHELVDVITTSDNVSAVSAYRDRTKNKSDRERQQDVKDKTGVFTGAYAINPVNDEKIPIWIADYVLTGYGTGAIMAVPAHDERDFAFAKKFGLPIRQVVSSGDLQTAQRGLEAHTTEVAHATAGEGIAVNSDFIDGLTTQDAKTRVIEYLEIESVGRRTVNYKLRDWLFSRQRYWGEPFPIVLDADGNHFAIAETELPLILPELNDFKPTGTPEAPLSKATDWLKYSDALTRETNTMPQWAGSCWYYLRYIDPTNDSAPVDREKEKYWMPVDLYVGGVEHAVLHLLYARFWHKVLFDLNVVSTSEPFQRLVNQGLILGEMEYHFFESPTGPVSAVDVRDITEEATDRGPTLVGYHKTTGEKLYATRVIDALVEQKNAQSVLRANANIVVDARSFKMSKSRGNVVNPDDIVKEYGADCFRLYEMYMGPLEAQKPWNTRDIVGMWRFLNGVWRNIGEKLIGSPVDPLNRDNKQDAQAATDQPINPSTNQLERHLHRAIKKISEDIEALRFNTAIAELIKLNNEFSKLDTVPRAIAETYVLLLSPFAPHMAEELWGMLGKPVSVQHAGWPAIDPALLVDAMIDIPVQVNGKLRDKLTLPADTDEATVFAAVEASDKVRPWIEGKTINKRVYVDKKLVNYVVA